MSIEPDREKFSLTHQLFSRGLKLVLISDTANIFDQGSP